MDEVSELNTNILLVGMLGMFVLALSIIFFIVVYQRRLLAQQTKHKELEAAHQLDLLKASLKTQELERVRIARDLHDEVGAMLSSTKLYFNQLELEEDRGQYLNLIDKVNHLFDETIHSVRRISQDLRPVILDNLGLVEAIRFFSDQVNEVAEFSVHLTTDYSNGLLNKGEELSVYRIVQELLNNALKHSKATEVKLTLTSSASKTILEYIDNGIGMPSGAVLQKSNSLGLKNMESRISILNGRLEIIEPKNGGTKIRIEI